ncbi:MAG TPA: TonB-dependent receptor [Ramlibacter sp.]|nr:TonB-dependent receptor [Ramlibacter sp.]
MIWCKGALLAAALTAATWAAAQDATVGSLADLTLEQLSGLEVTSVSGRSQSRRNAAASIYVITSDDIQRSAATSLPEVLRLAPNLQVAQLSASQWAISARGFNNAIADKLLVLIDGRTVYSTLFAGVFWDFHDLMLEDIDRIEVISGPGGTLWGANAVNGIINIQTKPASLTQGALVSVTRSHDGGQEAARWGGRIGQAYVRVYGLAIDRANTVMPSGAARADASSKHQGGFRADWVTCGDRLTVQGDLAASSRTPANDLAPDMRSANLLARWDSRMSDGSAYRVQASYDQYHRADASLLQNDATNVDLQFSHEPLALGAHRLLWGAGHRIARDDNDTTLLTTFIPARRSLAWSNVFVQDQVALGGRTNLTIGLKAERNSYSGIEWLPSVRLAHQHDGERTSWAALSRAVRAPSRIDRDLFIPGAPPFLLAGGPDFRSEVAQVLEAGHRATLGQISYDLTAYRQNYRGLRAGTSAVPTQIANRIEGYSAGLEAWGHWQASRRWRLSAGHTRFRADLKFAGNPPANPAAAIAGLGNDPRYQWSLRSQLDLGRRASADVTLRRVGALPWPAVAAYTAVDARLAWPLRADLEMAVIGQNLFDAGHHEFNAPAATSLIPRRLFLSLVWRP